MRNSWFWIWDLDHIAPTEILSLDKYAWFVDFDDVFGVLLFKKLTKKKWENGLNIPFKEYLDPHKTPSKCNGLFPGPCHNYLASFVKIGWYLLRFLLSNKQKMQVKT